MNLNGTEYYYVRNAQGDITGLIDGVKNPVVSYTYDTWGKLISTTGSLAGTLGVKNPWGYRYDTETGLYYLNSRYYNPEWSRFINADDSGILEVDQDSLIENNLFIYALNNPVNMSDESGYIAANIIGGVVGGASGALLGVMLAKQLGLTGWKRIAMISAATIGGAALGAFLGPYVSKLTKTMGSALKSAVKAATKAGSELCFIAGTPVKTDKGNIPIEKVKVGDYVYAENPETGEKGLKRVLQLFVNEVSKLVHVSVNDEEIITTPGHPFYVLEKGWVAADELIQGDKLLIYGSEYVAVEKVVSEYLSTPVTVYNLEIEDFHTYYVGETSILVHNKGCGFIKYSTKQLSKMVNGNFHGPNGVKDAILKDVPINILKQVGSNPDIAIARDGTIQLVSTIRKEFSIITNLNINLY